MVLGIDRLDSTKRLPHIRKRSKYLWKTPGAYSKCKITPDGCTISHICERVSYLKYKMDQLVGRTGFACQIDDP